MQYFPESESDKMSLESGSLETVKFTQFDDFCIREIMFSHSAFGDSLVYQLHYTEWPDHGCPSGLDHVQRFMEVMHSYQSEHGQGAPLLVHCSAGCGRTGTVIGADIYRELVERKVSALASAPSPLSSSPPRSTCASSCWSCASSAPRSSSRR